MEERELATLRVETLIDLVSSDEHHSQLVSMIKVLIATMESWDAVDVIAKILDVESYDAKKKKEIEARIKAEKAKEEEADD